MPAVAESSPVPLAAGSRENPFEPRLVALYRAASPEQKLAAVARLNHTLQGLKAAQLATDRPGWTDRQHREALRLWWLSGRD